MFLWSAGIMILSLLAATTLLIGGCHSKTGEIAAGGKAYYTCPMHSQIHEDKPGNCPICGMKLIKIEPDTSSAISLAASLRYLTEPVTQTVVGNFKVISAAKINLPDTITADGYTGFDERAVNTIAARVEGRIEKLYVKYTNQPIYKDEPLMKLYSPQLLSAQRNLLQAVKDKDERIANALKENLYNLGMRPQEVRQVLQSGQPLVDITIYSPYEGISRQIDTTLNMAAPELLSTREGMYVNAGQMVFSIQNISRVWVILNVFSRDIANVRQGDPVRLSSAADPAKIITGQVNFIPPYRAVAEKTTRVRVYLNRLPEDWKIGTLLRGNIIISRRKGGWFVPLSAVNRLGSSSVVWVMDKEHADVFHARSVITGEQTGDHIRVVSGLGDSDKIVENAAYMVDSDSFIQ